jgi:chemotaxis signal transduction protein
MEQRRRHPVQSRGLLVFNVGERSLAASVDDVAGLLDAEPLEPLPGRGAPMAGVLAFRGSVVPTLDLVSALCPEEPLDSGGYAIVFERGTDRFALLVRGMPCLVAAPDVVVIERHAPASAGSPIVTGDVADPSALGVAPTKGSLGPAGGADTAPAVLAVYEVSGERVEELDYWWLMDSVAPPAAFRLSGLGSR